MTSPTDLKASQTAHTIVPRKRASRLRAEAFATLAADRGKAMVPASHGSITRCRKQQGISEAL